MDPDSASSSAGRKPQGTPRRGEERRVVTTLFCDLVGFTSLSERNDAELIDAFLRRYYAAARRVVESYGGTVEKFIGDAVVAVFGVPTLHEDDPERAVRAGLRLVDELDALPGIGGQVVEVRVGVNTGEALVRLDVDPSSGEGFLTGDAVNVAARLQNAAPAMSVAVGETTHAATEKVFSFDACHAATLKGKRQPLRAWIATAPLARTGSELRTFSSAFVGREDELAALQELLDAATNERRPQCALICGEPGIGKSRLLAELARRLDDGPEPVAWRQGRCLPFGSNVTFWALSEIVRAAAGILESDGVARGAPRGRAARRRRPRPPEKPASPPTRPRGGGGLARGELLGLESVPGEPRRLGSGGARGRGPALGRRGDAGLHGLPRAEQRERATARACDRPAGGARAGRPRRRLRGDLQAGFPWPALRRGDRRARQVPPGGQVAAHRPAGADPRAQRRQPALRRGTRAPARGPRPAGKPRRQGRTQGAEVPLPDSISALIAARLDLLSAERKALLSDAAVVGRTFWVGAVAAVGGREPATVYEGVIELVAKELVRPERGSTIEGETEFLFVHALVCDVAYEQLTRADRAAKHAALAKWLEERTAGRTEDLAEVLAYHYGTALDMAASCGLLELEDELAEPTTRYLEMAGGRAAPLDASAAAAHFARAERVADEAAKPKRRWLLSRRTRRTLRRRAPLLMAAAAIIALAAVAALAIWAFAPAKTPSGAAKTMTAAQIAAKYGSSVVRITTPPMPPSATGKTTPSRIVGSGFMATKDGLIVTSLAVIQGKGMNYPATVTVEYALQSGEYGKVTGTVAIHDEGAGIAVVKVDPDRVSLSPLPLGTSGSLAENGQVTALGAQRNMSIQRASGVITSLGATLRDYYSGNAMTLGLFDDLKYPTSPGGEPLAVVGGPLFDTTGRVVGVVGPLGVGDNGVWYYEGDVTQQAVAIDWATRIVTFASKGGGYKRGKAYMGVEYTWLSRQVALTLDEHPGALVGAVTVGSPAEQAGISAGPGSGTVDGKNYLGLGGDVVVSVDGIRLTKEGQMETIVTRHKAGEVIPIQVWRDHRLVTVRVKLDVLAP